MKLVDRMEGVYEYRLETVVEAVVSGGLEDAWCEDRVQLDGSSFRRCMKRKSEINNTIENIHFETMELGRFLELTYFS